MNKLEIKDLNLFYGDFHALKNIQMNIEENRITAFIGPSGCGKSTLLRSINRMNDLVEGCRIEGQILLDGKNVYDRSMDINMLRKRVGMVFQKPNPFPMSIYDNIAYGPRTHGIRNRKKLDEIVEKSLRADSRCPRRAGDAHTFLDQKHPSVRRRGLFFDERRDGHVKPTVCQWGTAARQPGQAARHGRRVRHLPRAVRADPL